MVIQEEAKNCTTCMEWHKVCKAECCKSFTLIVPHLTARDLKNDGLKINKPLTADQEHYYRLHGCKYQHGMLSIDFSKYRMHIQARKIIFYRNCDWLKNNLCQGHPDLKPSICKTLDITKPDQLPGVSLTPNCLANFKGGG